MESVRQVCPHGASTRSTSLRGFTLLELLVVLAILAMLAGLVGPKVLDQFGKAKPKAAAVQIVDLDKTIELFKLDVGRYPTTEEGLDALVKNPGSVGGWAGPYLKGGLPLDPWQHPYKYTNLNGSAFDITSLGSDGAPGGEGEAADIHNTR